MADTSELSSFPFSELPVDQRGPPTVIQGPYVPLSTSTPICVPQDNQYTMDSVQDEPPFQQVLPNISQQSLYPSFIAMGTSLNTSVSPLIPFSRRVINSIEEHQRKALADSVEGTARGTNTSPFPDLEEQEEEVITPNTNLQATTPQADTQEEMLQLESLETEDTRVKQIHTAAEGQNTGNTDVRDVPDIIKSQIPNDGTNSQHNDEDDDIDMPDDQTSKVSQEDNYSIAIDDDDHDDTI